MEKQSLGEFHVEELTQYRDYVEGLLNQRFYFYLIFVTIFIASYGVEVDFVVRSMFVVVSIYVAHAMATLVSRSQSQIDVVLEELRNREGSLENVLNGASKKRRSKRRKLKDISWMLFWLVFFSGVFFFIRSLVGYQELLGILNEAISTITA